MLQGVVAVAASSSLNRASGSHTPQFMGVSQQQRDRRDPATEVLRAVGAGWRPLPQWSELRMPISDTLFEAVAEMREWLNTTTIYDDPELRSRIEALITQMELVRIELDTSRGSVHDRTHKA